MVARLGNLSALKDFFSFLATVSGDVSHITAPPFILAPSSLTEFPSYWAERPSLFIAPAHESSPERRALLVLKFYLASLQRQYYVGRTVQEGLKKPLNPFLGELFLCDFTDYDLTSEKESTSTVRVIGEQVSHHPPTTACYLSADEEGIHAEAYSTQHTTLSGTSIIVRQSGHARFTLDKYKETYMFPLPDVNARGVFSGVPWPELNDVYKIVSTSGFTAEMTFIGKKFWRGERNCFEASIYRTSDENKKAIFTLAGNWSSRFSIFNSAGKEIEVFDLSEAQNQPVPMNIKPVDQQNPWESRRAWQATFDAIRKGDQGSIVREKSKVEDAQRQMRKREKTEGKKWETMFFTRSDDVEDDSDAVQKLFDQYEDSEIDRLRGTNGCWKFDTRKEKRWKNGQGSWRPETPLG
ncbi:hypothetical protein LTR10_023753 [Elasticomyces elasticus]|uniref:Oxysterol-binding protein n=1 Tax=Exophiala sideris TaxID=1016849 RepID=A0ABR0JMT3_9EURO|nr:hypothetical protein LTR10_023753 [Elasticomyces elasticus]KAK5032220.1 hypothetical protein LTR13_007437 [Exophiala sideris]KAK5036218.1 hypothetical protein LTS07_001943 [Exophiala sideris]KAK5066601.1 hypothetical protein LTR69_001947 [Exophiala sideris]KAK5180423.1 hypothetical protein LTR44_007180 [Eurotiomycetes sp. CCFEE 6388]